MAETEKSKVPRLIEGADFKSLELEPTDGYILSQIDGSTPIADIGLVTGLGVDRVQSLVDKLVARNAIEMIEAPTGQPHAKRQPKERKSRGKRPPAPVEERPAKPRRKAPPPGHLYHPSELDEEVDLPRERRKQILDAFYTLADVTFYESLGVHPDSEKKEIRKAYFSLSKVFHPDTLYGKDLGSFKPKMEAVFHRLTEAYEVLGKAKRRRDYDAYIKLRLKALRAERSLEQAREEAEEIERQSGVPEAPAPAPEPMPTKADAPAEPAKPAKPAEPAEPAEPAVPAASAAPAKPAEPAPSAPPLVVVNPRAPAAGDDEAFDPGRAAVPPKPSSATARDVRRELMARKLAAASGRPIPSNRPAPPKRGSSGGREQVLRGLASSLKGTAEFTGGVDLAQRYIEQAKRLEEAGDIVAAASSMRLAVALAPERQDVVEYHDSLASEVAIDLADTYEAQAKYEEENAKWADAALSWSKVCDGRPNVAEPHWKAAHCLLTASGDLQQAKAYAQRAADLEPENPDAQRTLGLIFHAAGMKLNAKRTLELASELDPSDEMVENLLRELK